MFYERLLTEGNRRKKIGLTISATNHVLVLLKGAFNHAVEEGWLDKSPHRKIKKYKEGCSLDMHFTEDNINKKLLSKEEINLLVNSAETKADRFYDLYVFLLHTGLRSGEARALTYDDFDWEKKTVSVNKTLAELKDGFQISPPKSRKSKRVIPLDDAIVEMLRRHKERQDRYKQCCQEIYQDRNIVFASETGDYERGQRVLVHFQRAMKRAMASAVQCLKNITAS